MKIEKEYDKDIEYRKYNLYKEILLRRAIDMQRKALLRSKHMIAFALALSLTLSDASIVGAVTTVPKDTNAKTTEAVRVESGDTAETLAAGQEVVTPAKPGIVKNLRFDTKESGILNKSILSWDAVQGAEKYELRVTDASGREYASWATTVWDASLGKNVPVLRYSGGSDLSYDVHWFINNYSAYILNKDGTYYDNVYEDAEQNKAVMVSNGGTYYIYVRAVNTAVNGNDWSYSKDGIGDWSAPVKYTMPAPSKVEDISNVKLHEEENKTPFISFTAGNHNSRTEIEVKDALGREYFSDVYIDSDGNTKYEYDYIYNQFTLQQNYSWLSTWELKVDTNGNKYYSEVRDKDGNIIHPFEIGQTYTIRLRGVNTTSGKPSYSNWSAPVTCKITEVKKPLPEATGSVKFVAGDTNRISWNASKNAEGYEFDLREGNIWYNDWVSEYVNGSNVYQLVNCTTTSTGISTWNTYNSYTLINNGQAVATAKDTAGKEYTAFQPGHTYTLKVRAYNNNQGVKQYSAWTPAYTFTVPSDKPAVTKVTGVRAKSNGLTWDAEANAEDTNYRTEYQVEIKDASGRLYTNDPDDSAVSNANGSKTWNTEEQYYKVSGTYASRSSLENTCIYVADKDSTGKIVGYVPMIYTTGLAIHPYEPGKKYTFRVRALRVYADNNKPVYGAWSDAVTYTVDSAYISGIQGKPAKVTGLVLNTEEDYQLSSPELRWNKIENATYEMEIKDSKGNLFVDKAPTYINDTYVTNYISCGTDNYTYIANLTGRRSYVKKDGAALAVVQNAAGEDARTFEPGETYKIRVRAVNTYRKWNAVKNEFESTEYYYGDWSNTVTYKSPAATALKDLKYVRADEDWYYFTYNAKIDKSRVYYQIATDMNFSSASKVTANWQSYNSDNSNPNVFTLSKDRSDLEKGKTYYVRAVNYLNSLSYVKDINSLTDSEIAALKPSVAAFRTESNTAAKNIKGFKLYKENVDNFEFRFDAVLKSEDGDGYELQITEDPKTANWRTYAETTRLFKSELNVGTTYVRVVAYVWQKNELTGKMEKIYGTPSNVVSVTKSKATSSISKLAVRNIAESRIKFGFKGKVDKSQKVHYQWSDSKKFDTNGKADTKDGYVSNVVNNEFTISFDQFTPGKKYYVRARVQNDDSDSAANKYSKWTNVVTISTKIPKINAGVHSVTKSSITLSMGILNNDSYLTGYEIQRQNGKKWVDVVKTTDSSYTVKKLKADATYTFRVRPYYFNPKTGKFTNGSWVYAEGTTWGAALNLTAKASGKTAVKLTWKTVSGAKGYEVYRNLGGSSSTEVANGFGNGFNQYKLIKSLGAKSKSFTDTKLTPGMAYEYKVLAYKTVGGKKVTISEYRTVTLDWELRGISQVQKANGKVTWTWSPVAGAKGYLVEKLNSVTGKWSTYKNLKGSKKGSIILPKTTDAVGIRYRVRAYNGKNYTNTIECTVKPVLAAPKGVKAKANAKNGAITISWKKVKGADYYRVFRTTDSLNVFNKDRKGYQNTKASEVPMYVADKSKVSGYRFIEDTKDRKVTKLVDRKISYTRNGVTNTVYEGPKTGVTYYYYVVAYKHGKAYNWKELYDGDTIASLSSKPAKVLLKEAKPKKVTVTSVKAAKNKVTVKYKSAGDVDGYDILRSTNSKNGFKVVGTAKQTKTSYVDKKTKKNVLKKGKTYYYKVMAFTYDDAGNKVYGSTSAVKKVKAK